MKFKKLLFATGLMLSCTMGFAAFPVASQSAQTEQSAEVSVNTANPIISNENNDATNITEESKNSVGATSSTHAANQNQSGGKSQLAALLLCIFLGGLGIHRFYLGYIWQGVVQILTLGGFGIWWLIDLIRIITGDLKPKDGEYDKTF